MNSIHQLSLPLSILKNINFLDVLVTKSESGEKLCSSLYTKPADTLQYLHATSCHQAVYKNSIPYGQAIRLKRICSGENHIQWKLVSLESWLANRGYRAERVRPEIQKINLIDRVNLLIKKTKTPRKQYNISSYFSPSIKYSA